MKVASIWKRVEKSSDPKGCWYWTGVIDRDGYGQLSHGGKSTTGAHRVLYEMVNEVCIMPGYQIDHRCRVRNCVNPAHLEVVTHKENQRRRMKPRMHGPWATPAQLRQAKGICANDHVLAEVGILTSVDKNGKVKTKCRACQHDAQERNRRKNGMRDWGRRGAYGPRTKKVEAA